MDACDRGQNCAIYGGSYRDEVELPAYSRPLSIHTTCSYLQTAKSAVGKLSTGSDT
jgi:hypothetical protein